MYSPNSYSLMARFRAITVNKKESGETLLGTLLGVLLLSVMTASFAGVIFASAASTGRANEISNRVTVINTVSSDALTDLRVERVTPPTGWSANAPITVAGVFYTYNSSYTLPNNSAVTVRQWGTVIDGVVSVYTSVPKPKATYTCDVTNAINNSAAFKNACLLSYSSSLSVLTPLTPNPLGANVDWRNNVVANTAVSSATPTVASLTPTSGTWVTTTASTVITATMPAVASAQTLKYVFNASGVTAARIVTFKSGTTTLGTATIPAGTNGYISGTLTTAFPANATSVTITINGAATLSKIAVYGPRN